MRTLLLLLALSLFSMNARAEPPAAMTVSQAYAFAVATAGQNGAAFLTLTYPIGDGIVADRITGVSSPVAEKAALHTMSVDDNIMTMRQVDSLPLPPTGTFMLKPQGVHVMLMDLKQPLKKGETFPLTLVFARAGAITTSVSIRAPGDIPAPDKTMDKTMPAMKMDMPMDHSQHGM